MENCGGSLNTKKTLLRSYKSFLDIVSPPYKNLRRYPHHAGIYDIIILDTYHPLPPRLNSYQAKVIAYNTYLGFYICKGFYIKNISKSYEVITLSDDFKRKDAMQLVFAEVEYKKFFWLIKSNEYC